MAQPPVAVVLGTGAMAPEMAAACAAAGYRVRVAGRDAGRAAAAAERATGLAEGAPVGHGPIAAEAFADAAVVLETVVEHLDTKRDLLAQVEGWCPPDAVVCTNTSSLTIADIASALTRPERFAGLHFLKPAHLTGVVEVVPGPATDPGVVDALRDLAARMGKRPLVVRADVPGFIWNRIQFAVLRECLHMLETGVASAEDIDAAMSDGLAPRWTAAGPLATADLGGLGTFTVVSRGLFPHLADTHEVSPELTGRRERGEPFAPWTATAGEAVAGLRAEALRAGREIARRRREITG
jgi:3-hydroxybutyryl-CoA dehydrogenase